MFNNNTNVGSQLPREPPARLREKGVSAYGMCLDLEKELQKEAEAGNDVVKKLMHCRIVGYLFHHAPTDQALKTVVYEVLSCENNEKLLNLGQIYYDHFLRAFRSNKGHTPTPLSHPSRPSFHSLSDNIKEIMKKEKTHLDCRTSKKNALIREEFRCAISGAYDVNCVDKYQELQTEVQVGNIRPVLTQCAHIFPESTNANIERLDKETFAINVWSILKRFGYGQLPKELSGENVHRLENVITLETSLHGLFDSLRLWLVATEVQHRYKLKARRGYHLMTLPTYVTLTTPDPANLPLPSPAYLKIHAACCEVAHLSGASDYIEQLFEDMEETKVLSQDGSSKMLLEEALLRAATRPIVI